MPMRTSVVVRLAGGLGNQMFQDAAGRAVALATGRRLLLDEAGILRGPSGRRYELPVFRIAGVPAGLLDRTLVRAQVGGRVPPALRDIVRATSRRRWTLLGDREAGFDERLFTTAGDLVLDGFWQSAGYPDRTPEIAGQLRHDFALRQPLPDRLAAVAAEVAACESVGVHVRRGDYAHDPTIAAVHGTLPLDYYAAAAAWLAARRDAPSFFVFSDDPAWARAHLRLPGPTRVVDEAAGLSPAVDQRLLASCRHFIVANSTFSWWAAWLGASPDKLVVAPRQWFADRPTPAGLLPASWTVL
jgi:hypothetical protein